jgi:DNA-binding GntR family transcriptional regulator
MDKLKRVQGQSSAEAAATTLRAAIVKGELAPGDHLAEQELAAALGTSQSTVREALRKLESQGFVRRKPGKGTFVTELTKEEIKKSLEVRMALERLAIERAAPRMTPEAAGKLRQLVDEMATAAQEMDRTRFHCADLDFHQIVWDLADNTYLAEALCPIASSLFASVLPSKGQLEFQKAVEQHRFILNGLLSGNVAQARDVFLKATVDFWNKHHNLGLREDLSPG